MNCKQGDLAIIVKSRAGNEGKIVRCVKFIGKAFDSNGIRMVRDDHWLIDMVVYTNTGATSSSIPDGYMRPLRGDLLDDEITTSKEQEAA